MTRPEPLFSIAVSVEEKILRRVPREILLLTLACTVPVYVLLDLSAALLFLAGGLFSTLNFLGLKRTLTRTLAAKKKRRVPSLLALYGLRLVLILGIFFIIILFFSKKILAFAAGFSTIIPVFLVEGIIGLFSLKQWKS